MKTYTSKNGTQYNIIETNLKESDFYGFKMTDKAVQIKIEMKIKTVGDVVGYVWLPHWAVKNNEIWLTQKMNDFKVWTKNGEFNLNQNEFINAINF